MTVYGGKGLVKNLLVTEHYYATKENGLWWTYKKGENKKIGYSNTKAEIQKMLKRYETNNR